MNLGTLLGIPVMTVALQDGAAGAQEHEQHVRVEAYNADAVAAVRNRVGLCLGAA